MNSIYDIITDSETIVAFAESAGFDFVSRFANTLSFKHYKFDNEIEVSIPITVDLFLQILSRNIIAGTKAAVIKEIKEL